MPDSDEPTSADGEPASADGDLASIDGDLASIDGDLDEIDLEDAAAALSIAAPGPARGLASQAALASALEPIEAEPRPPRPSRWGRLDLMVAWHRAYDATDQGSSRRDELWLLAIWSR